MHDDDDFEALYDPETIAAVDGWEERFVGPVEVPITSRLVSWSRESMTGLVITGWARGLKEVLDPEREATIVIEVDDAGEPHDLPIRLFLDPDDPSGSLCIVRRDPPPPVV